MWLLNLYFLFVLLRYIFVCFCSDWDCDTVMITVSLFWKKIPIMTVLFTHRNQYNGIWCDCLTGDRFSAIKLGSIHHFLHKKMPVLSQEYDSYYPFFDVFELLILSFHLDLYLDLTIRVGCKQNFTTKETISASQIWPFIFKPRVPQG